MFQGRPLTNYPQPQQQQPQQQWPMSQDTFNNMRSSQLNTPPTKKIAIKIYLPEDEIRRSNIDSSFNLEKITSKVQSYASVNNKEIHLSWMDEQKEWIRFDTEEEFSEAMSYANTLVGTAFKVSAKIKKSANQSPKKKQTAVEQQIPVQQPIQQPPVQPIQQPPVQPFRSPPMQQTIQQPMQMQNMPQTMQQPMQQQMQTIPQPNYNAFQPMQTMQQPPMQNMPFQNQPMVRGLQNQPQTQPQVLSQPQYSSFNPQMQTPTKTLTSSVTLSPHPLNQMGNSINSDRSTPTSQPLTNNDALNFSNQLQILNSMGFNDSTLNIKLLKENNGDVNQAIAKLCGN